MPLSFVVHSSCSIRYVHMVQRWINEWMNGITRILLSWHFYLYFCSVFITLLRAQFARTETLPYKRKNINRQRRHIQRPPILKQSKCWFSYWKCNKSRCIVCLMLTVTIWLRRNTQFDKMGCGETSSRKQNKLLLTENLSPINSTIRISTSRQKNCLFSTAQITSNGITYGQQSHGEPQFAIDILYETKIVNRKWAKNILRLNCKWQN